MLRHRLPRFVESGDDAQLPWAHLWSPIALGDRLRERGPADVAARIAAHLERGLLYYFSSPQVKLEAPSAASLMFPATPLRLDAGMLLARERIVTARSGTYGWDDGATHEVHVFGADGREMANAGSRTFEENGKRWTALTLGSGKTAVVVRRP
jgi:hypothetical protein